MKIGVLTNAFRESNLLGDCIQQFSGFGFEHLVVYPWFSWSNDLENDRDTMMVARKMDALVHQIYKKIPEHEQINQGISVLAEQGCDWILLVDADERYHPDDIEKIVDQLEAMPESIAAAKIIDWVVYWKTDYRIEPPQDFLPIVAVRSTTRMSSLRNPHLGEHEQVGYLGAKMHHFSYSRTDDDMLKKVLSFSHANEFNVMDWYENVWLKWYPQMFDLHPVVPEQFKCAVWSPAPDGVRKVYS